MAGVLDRVHNLDSEIGERPLKCHNCVFLVNIEWTGDKPNVSCAHPFYVPITSIDPECGCPFGTLISKETASDNQTKLF